MKRILPIFLFIAFFCACTGSKKYFKAAARLEKQGLVADAAQYYLESLQLKPTNVDARIKLKEVGQKHILNLASEFFRNYNTEQLEASLESFEQLKDFSDKANALNVQFDYPKTYEEDYQKSIEIYCLKYFNQAHIKVKQKQYNQAIPLINLVKKYNPGYKNIAQLETISICEPLYQSAINSLENKNYTSALSLLNFITEKNGNYKDSQDLLELAIAQQNKSFILFQPVPSKDAATRNIQDQLFNDFGQAANQKLKTIKIINNTPFQNSPSNFDLDNSNNIDLIQAIKKATGADFFYVYDVINKKEFESGTQKKPARAYQEIKTKKNDTLTITEYNAVNFNYVKSQRSFSYEFKYKLINAYSNQIVVSQTQNMVSEDAVEYQEFARAYNGNINQLYPYHPQQTAPIAQYNPRNWRSAFSARNTLKTFEELKNEVYTKTINTFISTAENIK